ncbi:MAG TPA: hypothetical protein DIW31_06545 [Bacteroidales bacterium]|nr:hypothetical protein [Bacteroidales bacterium]
MPEHTFSLGLPGNSSVYTQFITNGFRPGKVVTIKNDTLHIDPNKLLSELSDKNLIYSGTSVDLFHLRLKIRNGYYWIGARTNVEVNFQYPKDIIELAIKGNEWLIGREMDLSNLKFDATLYNEFSYGMALEYNRWVFGGRISLLQGLSNVQFDPKSLNMRVDTLNFRQTMNADARLNTAGIPMNGEGDISFDNVSDINYITDYLTNFKNRGFALSAGATYKMSDRLRFSASFYDLGYINWKDSVVNYNLKGQSSFSGIDILSSYLNGEDIQADTIIDAIIDDFNRDTINKAYTTYLKPKFNLSVNYNIFRRTIVGFSASGVYNKKLYPAFTLGLQQGLGRFLNLLATISYNQKTIKNLGVGFVIKPGPFQFFVITDNIYPIFNQDYTTNVNVRFGMNIVLGRVKPAAGLPYR